MTRGLRRRRLRRAAPPVAAADLRRGDAALRLRQARHALRPRAARRGGRSCAARSSRSSSPCSRRRRRCARSTPGRARCRARSSTGSTRSSSATAPRRSRRSSPGDGGWRRQPREVLRARADRRGRRGARGRRRRPAAVRRRPGARRRAEALGALRLELGERFGLIAEDVTTSSGSSTSRCSSATEDGRWTAIHHPFTRRRAATFDDPGARCARAAYDLVLDGVEIGGGSIRIHTPEVQQQVFEVLGMDEEEAQRALRLPARRAALRRAAARRHRDGHRPDRRDPGRPRLDPRRHRLPEDRDRAATRSPARRRRSTRGSCASSALRSLVEPSSER